MGADRDLQDEIIHYLTDPGVRVASANQLKIHPEQAERARRFSLFLARRYYRDRLTRSFRYSAMFAEEISRRAADILDSLEFTKVMKQHALGSLDIAEMTGRAAVNWLKGAKQEAWWPALLEYEYSHFLQTATSEMSVPAEFLHRGRSTVCVRFDWHLPELLQRLRDKQPIEPELQRPVTLLFSRTRAGRIYVMEIDEVTTTILDSATGRRDQQEIANHCLVSPEFARQIIDSLIEIGALVPPAANAKQEQFQPARVLGI